MKIQTQKKIISKKGMLVTPIFVENLKKLPGNFPKEAAQFISHWVNEKEFKAEKRETIYTHLQSKDLPHKLLVIGLGKAEKFNAKTAREIGAKIVKMAKTHKSKEVTLVLVDKMLPHIEELLEGVNFAQYEFDLFKTSKKENSLHKTIQTLDLVTDKKVDLESAVTKASLLCEGMNFAKDLINSPSNHVDASYLSNEAMKIAKENGYGVEIFGKKELVKMGWGGLLAVNQGSNKEPKCAVLKYFGAADKNEKPIILIGKGVIFDTGGYNLKPSNHIETMHQDMAGAATVLGIFKILKKLGIKKNVFGVTPMAENLVSAEAYRPSDIIRMYSGKTVEITNTDAEGRLILADAITYSTKQNPEAIITIATLTGAVAVALGDRYAGLLSNNVKLRNSLQKAGREACDLGWPLPLHPDFKMKMKSDVADIRNCDLGTQRYAGSSKGAAFLERFVEGKKWCHIDIGGTAFTVDPLEYQTKGATGHGFRMLVRYLENQQ